MNERNLEYIAGIFVILGLTLAGYLAVSVGGHVFFRPEGLVLHAEFANVGGLKEGSKVRLAGVDVGTVRKIALDPETYHAKVTIALDAGVELDEDTIASIRTNGLIGEKFVAVQPGGSGIPLEDGAVIFDTESALDIESLISRIAFGGVE